MRTPTLVLAAVVVALIAVVIVLRETTMTRHEAVPPDSRLVVEFTVSSRGVDEDRAAQLTDAAFRACALQTAGGIVATLERVGDRYVGVLRPTLDDPNQRQFRGCLQDIRVQHLLLNVKEMRTEIDAPAAPP
jgi:hypothetical protein